MKCERLDVWKRACRLSVDVYRHVDRISNLGFKEQISRSCLSVASNIAEGVEKESPKEKLRYLEIARGSLAEFVTQSYIGIEAGFVEKSGGLCWVKEADELSRMIIGLKRNYAP